MPQNKPFEQKVMNVLFVPDYSSGNPYQRELAGALRNLGVTVQYQSHASGPLALTRIILKNKNLDILHIHWMDSLIPISTNRIKSFFKTMILFIDFMIVKLLRTKIIWTVHNRMSHGAPHEKLELFTRRLLARNCHKIIVHCPRILEDLAAFYKINKEKFKTIPHGHFIDSYPNAISKNSARQQLKISLDHIIYLCLGTIRSNKGCLDLNDSFKNLNSSSSTLIIAGNPTNPEIKKEIKARAGDADNIKRYLHFINEDQMQIFLNAADIVVLPYKDILNSGVAVLAMSFKKALIAPALGCLPDIIDPKGGFLVEPMEKDALNQSLQKAAQADLGTMGEHNFNNIKKYTWLFVARKTYQTYRHSTQNE